MLCFAACPPGFYGVGCASQCRCEHADGCDPVSGECLCQPGWFGPTCSQSQHSSVHGRFYVGAGGHVPPPRFTCFLQIQKLADRSDVIYEVPNCIKIQIFWRSACSAPLHLLTDGRGSLPPSKNTPRLYRSQGLTHYRVGNPTNDRFQILAYNMKLVFFSFSKNGENGFGDEGADGAMPLRIFGLEPPLLPSSNRHAYQ